jgi:putative DNA-invertase from lambdoid prophage Rac
VARAKAEGKTLGRPVKTSDSQRAEIISMKKKGASVSALSRTYGVSRASIMRVTGDL